MATMTIRTFLGRGSKEFEQRGSPVHYPNGGGYASLEDMRRELKRRNNHLQVEIIPDGIRLVRTDGAGPERQDITWTEGSEG